MGKDRLRDQKPEWEGRDIPNEETLEAFAETDRKMKAGNIERFSGNTEEFIRKLLDEELSKS